MFAICISVSKGKGTIAQGMEQLATMFARCTYYLFYHLIVMDPTSHYLKYMHWRCRRVLDPKIDFTAFPSYHTMIMVDALARQAWNHHNIWSTGNRPSNDEYFQFAQNIVELAQVEHQRKQKVPKWILDFVFTSLSLDPLPPAFVVVDCLKVIAIDFGCDISDVVAQDQRYACLSFMRNSPSN